MWRIQKLDFTTGGFMFYGFCFMFYEFSTLTQGVSTQLPER